MSTVYELGPFRLDVEAAVLTHAGVPVALGSRGVAVLRTLVKHPHEYVGKDSIIDTAWPGVVVEESNLAVQISAIRRVLARAPGGELWIETLARRGYRFVGPVTELSDPRALAEAGGVSRSNLPVAATSFVGRERELVEIKRLLPRRRLVTLVGAGGIGKTRLAVQVAAEVLDAYRDGVWLVELGSTTDPSLIFTTVAQVLGVQERGATPLIQTLCRYLRTRQILLILDNCEHLRDACATLVATIIRETVEATVIATSREPLQVVGEQIYPLPTLSLPEVMANEDAIGSSEAVQLFVERARRQQPGFDLTAARAPIIAELCSHLDGIPLALELAAARIRSLSVEQINARLNNRFRLLTGGIRTALPRQQTLRATLDWSYDLLAEEERVVLRRLAVFPGTFALEAASSIASDQAIDDYAVIDLLSQLVSRSLVVADTNHAGARYRLLETTRAYALEKLAEAGESAGISRRHAQHFRDCFERAADDWLHKPDADWCTEYFPERDNVRAALDWALGERGDAVVGVALAGASGALWTEMSLAREGRERLGAAARAGVESHASESDLARLWRWLGSLWEAAPPQALPACQRAIDLYRRLDDALGLGLSLTQMGASLSYMGRFERAAPFFAEAFPLLKSAAPPKALAEYLLQFGAMKMLAGDLPAARTHYENALSLSLRAGAERMALLALMYLADMTWASGELAAALVRFRETVALARKSPLRRLALGFCLTNLAGVHAERGELDEALEAAREGMPMLREAGQVWLLLDHFALLAARAGKTVNAARIAGYADSARATKGVARQPNEARARDRIQTLLAETLDPDGLLRLLAEGAAMSEDEAVRLALDG